MTMHKSDFGGEFAVGSVVGLRAWRYRAEHWGGQRPPEDAPLVSIFRRYAWRAGANIAQCLLAPGQTANTTVAVAAKTPYYGYKAPKPHDLEDAGGLVPEHSCGFYAYTEAEALRSQGDGPVCGIIAGWGRTVIGSRGFRTSTAKILALAPNPEYRNRGATVLIDLEETLEKATAVYGCGLYATLEEMLADYELGPDPGTRLLPP